MTVEAAASAPGTEHVPPARRRRGWWAWIAIAVFLVAVAGAGAALSSSGQWTQKEPLDPDSAGPTGARALAQVLRMQGVEVRVSRGLAATESALSRTGGDPGTPRRADATLLLSSTSHLDDAALRRLSDAAADVVLLDPDARDIRLLFPGSELLGVPAAEAVRPDCDQADALRAGPVVPGAVFSAPTAPDGANCYPAANGYGMLSLQRDGDRLTAIGAQDLFSNARLAEDGGAALALGLAGRHPLVVWYVGSPLDAAGGAPPSLGELTPRWVTPVIVLLAISAVVAAVWRGRRFGPLVPENLPVTVRAGETMEGRARLYARARDAAHALDALRLGTLDRVASLLGLGPAATATVIADAAADRLGVDRRLVRDILLDAVPSADAELVAASDRLRDLEDAVRASVRDASGSRSADTRTADPRTERSVP